MKYADLFGRATSRWIRYSDYEAKQDKNWDWYITPSSDATSAVYDPIETAEENGCGRAEYRPILH